MPAALQSSPKVNVLTYLRSKSSIDYDCLELRVAKELGPFEDCTSNQWEAYSQLCVSENASLIEDAAEQARQWAAGYRNVSAEELAVEIAMIQLSLRAVPLIKGSIHVMCNPLYSWDTKRIVETGQRFHNICGRLDDSFDLSRLIMKVPATWEGLQACRLLKTKNIKTLATTLFTMEQVVLAGEAGCISISPFAHELRAHAEVAYHDPAPILDLFLQAQQYYEQHGIKTKVKSCAFMTTDEILQMAGVDAMTLPAEVFEELSKMEDEQERLESLSVFHKAAHALPAHPARLTRLSYIDDRSKFDRDYTTNGRGKAKTEDSIAVFCGFQVQAEELMAKAGLKSKL